MDRALWITWYDLPEQGRDEYLQWMHTEYLPALLERGRFLHAAHFASVPPGEMSQTRQPGGLRHTQDAAVPTGCRYILIVGAEDASAFGDPTPSELHASLSVDMREMLAKRVGVRQNIMVEATRVCGPEEKSYAGGMRLPPCIQIGSFQISWEHEEEVHAWYTQWRMRAMETLPGCIRTRRLASVGGWAKQAVLYEFVSLEARNRYFRHHEDDRPDMKAWSDRTVAHLVHAPGSANLCNRIWPVGALKSEGVKE
jgi:hypothetical protein